jgi:hypothetical protein
MAFPSPGTLEVAKKQFELEYVRQALQLHDDKDAA